MGINDRELEHRKSADRTFPVGSTIAALSILRWRPDFQVIDEDTRLIAKRKPSLAVAFDQGGTLLVNEIFDWTREVMYRSDQTAHRAWLGTLNPGRSRHRKTLYHILATLSSGQGPRVQASLDLIHDCYGYLGDTIERENLNRLINDEINQGRLTVHTPSPSGTLDSVIKSGWKPTRIFTTYQAHLDPLDIEDLSSSQTLDSVIKSGWWEGPDPALFGVAENYIRGSGDRRVEREKAHNKKKASGVVLNPPSAPEPKKVKTAKPTPIWVNQGTYDLHRVAKRDLEAVMQCLNSTAEALMVLEPRVRLIWLHKWLTDERSRPIQIKVWFARKGEAKDYRVSQMHDLLPEANSDFNEWWNHPMTQVQWRDLSQQPCEFDALMEAPFKSLKEMEVLPALLPQGPIRKPAPAVPEAPRCECDLSRPQDEYDHDQKQSAFALSWRIEHDTFKGLVSFCTVKES